MMADWKTSIDFVQNLSKSNIKPLRELGELNLSTWEKLIKRQMEIFDLFIDTSAEQMNLTAQSVDTGGFVNSQAGLSCRFGQSVIDNGQKTIALGSEINQAYHKWLAYSVNNLFKSINGLTVNPA